jgi:hypothetical protein
MNRRSRLGRIEKHLSVTHGPTEACPSCSGRGKVEQIDGERTAARLAHRVALVNAKLLGTPAPGSLVLPDEPERKCLPCKGTGRRPRAVVEALASLPDDSGDRLTAMMLDTARRMDGSSIDPA